MRFIAGLSVVALLSVLIHGAAGSVAPSRSAVSSHGAVSGRQARSSQSAVSSGTVSGASGTISGASQATCAPGPCSIGTNSTYTLAAVSNDNGTTSTRAYGVYRPKNLTPSQTNRVPAVLVFYGGGNCGFIPASRFSELAAANRFIVVYMEVPCGRDDNWDKKNTDSPAPTVPNDEPYVAAVVQAITQCPSTGPAPNQCVDPQRIYAAGMSSGGNMTADVMCDMDNSALFRGYLIDSSSLQLYNGSPDCPSTNRSYFVMMALSNYSIDGGLYYGTTPNPHLDVPAFADWAAHRLGCQGPRVDDAIGSPVASTLRYSYSGPCAFAQAGSEAVVTLGVQNGAHTFGCQDSDPNTPPNPCPGMPNPPGLGPSGRPQTNGLFIEGEFWAFVAQGLSSANPAPPLAPSPTAPTSAYIALGDGYSSGDGNSPYLAATDTRRDRCHRSVVSYPFIANALRGNPLSLSMHACAGAQIVDFRHVNRRNHEPPQLHWVGTNSRVVSLSIGWADASLPAVMQSCVLKSAECEARWHAGVNARIRAMASRRSPESLYSLYEQIRSDARNAEIIVFGYPRMFPAVPRRRCNTGIGHLSLTNGATKWIDSEILKLDRAIQRAASAAHVVYVGGSYRAFAGREACTMHPDLRTALSRAESSRLRSHSILPESFTPNRRGQLALAQRLEKLL